MAKTEWTTKDQRAALKEGWAIFNEDSGRPEIQKDDEQTQFPSDQYAQIHVMSRANAGSDLHRRALVLIGLAQASKRPRNVGKAIKPEPLPKKWYRVKWTEEYEQVREAESEETALEERDDEDSFQGCLESSAQEVRRCDKCDGRGHGSRGGRCGACQDGWVDVPEAAS